MASLQARRVRGHTYWHIVESRRVNGKPRPVPIAYLGKADDLLSRLRAAEALRLNSFAHGDVAALWRQAQQLDLAGIIDRELQHTGRRLSGAGLAAAQPRQAPVKNDGLSVGQTMTLCCIGRACHATSKRGFAQWAATTTLRELAGVELPRLSSQHFWDQMDQIPVESIARIESELTQRLLPELEPLDTLLFDATNFFSFIASTNHRCDLPARGHNKQKRDDLRQVGVALLCSRQTGLPSFIKPTAAPWLTPPAFSRCSRPSERAWSRCTARSNRSPWSSTRATSRAPISSWSTRPNCITSPA